MNPFKILEQLKLFYANTSLLIILGISSILLSSKSAHAQTSTSHSPYSQFGLGQMREDLLPQTRAMGGISTAVRFQGGLPVLNISNPAAYSAFTKTILDAGLYGNITQLEKGATAADNTADFAFSHFAFGFTLNKNNGLKLGGISFGLMPYSDIGYNTSANREISNTPYQTRLVGEGGLNKAYVGWGVSPFKNFSIGANIGYLFGNLYDKLLIDFPNGYGYYNTSQTDTRRVTGAVFDYGAQYFVPLGNKKFLTIGYSGSLNNAVRNKVSTLVTRTRTDVSSDIQEQVPIDTALNDLLSNNKINLPLKHNVGVTLSKGVNWMVGADFKYADWSNYQVRQGEDKLGKNLGIAIGGQFKPDPTAINYLKVIDYRLGFRYNKTHMTVNKERINDMAVTVGLGLPLPETGFGRTFSNINISAELGQQGTLKSNLIRERYININLGFTINDSWFIRRSYD